MEEEKTCKTWKRLNEKGFCSLQSAREIEECIGNGLSHWLSIYNQQYAIDMDYVDDIK